MAFKKAVDVAAAQNTVSNSSEASRFLAMYKTNVRDGLLSDMHMPSKTFAPSSLRCKRQQWFRLRGTKPDVFNEPDVTLDFIADLGTHCHENIQSNLEKFLGDGWLDVESYLKDHNPGYSYTCEKSGYETRIKVDNPAIKFACDGLIRFEGEIYLLEIKTSERKSMEKLVMPKSEHLDQIKCYCTLLNVENAMVVYQDRQYGSLKCFTYHVSDDDRKYILDIFEDVYIHVKRNIVPSALPVGDKWCNSSYCRYFKTCRKWGV